MQDAQQIYRIDVFYIGGYHDERQAVVLESSGSSHSARNASEGKMVRNENRVCISKP